MDVTVGTFNLNNLFTRWNFQAAVPPGTILTETLEFGADDDVRFRTFKGNLVKGKDPDDTAAVAQRVLTMNVDVLAVQEVENIEALRTFNTDSLGGMYSTVVLIEGNDPRLIDVGVLSKLPLRQIVSSQTEPDPANPSRRVFGRDVVQVDVLTPSLSRKLFSLFNTHLKSNFVDFREPDRVAAAKANNERRQRQATVMRNVVDRATRAGSRFVVVGDMNDDPGSLHMAPLVADAKLGLVDALIGVVETRPSKAESLGPQPDARWTSRFKESGQPPEHRLFDQIWVSPSLAGRTASPTIDRRTKHSGDGSDHDPAWITITGL